jgi:thiamine biosynthesis lipoprotein
MDTVMIFTAYGEKSTHAALAAEDRVQELDELWSRTKEDSEISRLNSAPAETPVELSEVTAQALEAALRWSDLTGGAFDCTLAPVSSAWGFTEDSFRVPSQAELQELLTYVGSDKVHLEGNRASHAEGTQVDLGGIAKGITSDIVADIFEENGVPRGTVSLGGNVYVCGDRVDGEPWRVAIQDPRQPETANAYACVLNLMDAFAVTSGGYERYFEENGKTYHHILDPSTGYPAESGLLSVTVVAQRQAGAGTGAMCDALSTALFVMGEEQALDFWRSSEADFELVLVTEDGRVVVTDGLADRLVTTEDSGYAYEIVS